MAAGQPVPFGDDGRVAVVEQAGQLQILAQRAARRLEVVHHGQVKLATLELRGRFLGLHLNDVQLDARMSPVERVDRRRDQGGTRALEGSQAQAAGTRLDVGNEIAFGVRDPAQDRPRVRKQQLAGLRQPRAFATAFDQSGASLALESGDLLADRRLRVGEGVSGSCERAPLGERTQNHEALRIQH